MSKALIYAVFIFFTTQTAVWFQTNGQFISEWCKNNSFILSLFGIPISFGYIYATKWAYLAFDNLLWPFQIDLYYKKPYLYYCTRQYYRE